MLIRLVRTYLPPYRRHLVAVVLLQFVATGAMLYLPTLNADIIDDGVAAGDTGYILRVGVIMLGVTVLQVVTTIAAQFFGARGSLGIGRNIRHDLLHTVDGFSAREVGRFGAPSLITRTTNDVQQVQMLMVMATAILVSAPIMCVGGIVMGVHVASGLAWVLVVAVPILGGAMAVLISKMVPGFRAMQERLDSINQVLREQITGIRVVRAFVRETYETDRFGVANDELSAATLRVGKMMALMFPVILLISNTTIVAIIWIGGHRIDDGALEIGSLTAMISYVMQIMMSVMMASFLAMMAPRASVCAERILEVLDTESSVHAPDEPVGFTADPANVEFSGAEFRYPGADSPVLSGISFRITPGTITAIVGSTGSGKTTLLSLIPRLIDVTDGSVSVGDTDVRLLDPDRLREVIGLVPQRPYLFSGTVASNRRYGKADATDEEIW